MTKTMQKQKQNLYTYTPLALLTHEILCVVQTP